MECVILIENNSNCKTCKHEYKNDIMDDHYCKVFKISLYSFASLENICEGSYEKEKINTKG